MPKTPSSREKERDVETGSHEHSDAQFPAPRRDSSQSGYQTCNRTQHQNQTQKNERHVGEHSVRKRQTLAFGAADPQEGQRQRSGPADSSNMATERRSTPWLIDFAHHSVSPRLVENQTYRTRPNTSENRQRRAPASESRIRPIVRTIWSGHSRSNVPISGGFKW